MLSHQQELTRAPSFEVRAMTFSFFQFELEGHKQGRHRQPEDFIFQIYVTSIYATSINVAKNTGPTA